MPRPAPDVATRRPRLAQPFRIAGRVSGTADVVTVTLRDGLHREGGRDGVHHPGDDLPHTLAALDRVRTR